MVDSLAALPVIILLVLACGWILLRLIRTTSQVQATQGAEIARLEIRVQEMDKLVQAARLETWKCEQRYDILAKLIREHGIAVPDQWE